MNLEIKNQKNTDFCLGCAIASCGEFLIGEPCEESFSYAMGKKYSGQDIAKQGLPVKAGMLGAIEYGVLPKSKSPYSIDNHSRDFLADWRNWEDLQKFAVKPFKSFKKVKPFTYDYKYPAIIGIFWQLDWSSGHSITAKNSDSWNKFSPHEVLGIMNLEDKLVIQNSRGQVVGDKGLWYADKNSKEVYNVIDHAYILLPSDWSNLLSKFINIYL